MFNIFSRKGNVNQKYTEIPSHPNQTGNHQENKQQQMLVRMGVVDGGWGSVRNPPTLLVGM
jgi:hypothetical protein